ncbi:MAG: Gfo/Idh/MocA family oxidoreductase [Lachnospiraceae bacterium]|nr:Gfo/Idh/MocA family oxidoreductase [Lachnospiraceae bacterium]MCI9150563.1 Gfo/Idh/MocA family oxidoreductase [Lachnospiraceae bacterium]
MSNPLRIAIVGCGGMGGGHAIAIASGSGNAVWNSNEDDAKRGGTHDTDISKKLVLAGTYDIAEDRQKWAQEHGYHTFASFEEILADDTVDAVLIATPNHLHHDMAIAAMRAGKDVLCEKPVMISSAELLDVLAVAKETGKVFYPRQNRRWDKDYRIIKKIYDEKLVGEIFNIECRIMGSRGIPGDWRGVKEYGGGMMLDWGVHIIDRLLVMVPEKVKRVFCSCTHITNEECDDGFKLHLTFESGLTSVLEVGTCHFIPSPVWAIYGNYGSARVDNWDCEGVMMRLTDWSDKDTKPILAGAGLTKTMAPRLGNSVDELPLPEVEFDNNELYSNFVDVCRGEAEQIVTGEQAVRVLRLMEAAFQSDETGQVVNFE